MGYLDRTFCSAAGRCKNNTGCYRYMSPALMEKAELWAIQCRMLDKDGNPAPWIAWSDFSNHCPSYEETQ
jgi:hypothetical protein